MPMRIIEPSCATIPARTPRRERTLSNHPRRPLGSADVQISPTVAELERCMRGPAFTRTVAGYVFERVR
jgi:hypothetical protein